MDSSLALVDILYKILPGLMAAVVFHAITPFPKRDVFDRLVNALVFTAIGQIFVFLAKPILLWIGQGFALGPWSENASLFIASLGAVLFAVSLAWSLNSDALHKGLRAIGITKRVALPSPWYSAHSRYENYITLVLKDGRRILGWPKEWPDNHEQGHYVLVEMSWLLDDGEELPQHDIEAMLVDAADVESVHFMKFSYANLSECERVAIEHSRTRLIQLAKNGDADES